MSRCWRCSPVSRRVVGNLLSFNRRGMAAVLSALVFAAIFVAWTYYPHGLPLPTRLAPDLLDLLRRP